MALRPRLTVLVVEDIEVNRDLLIQLLEDTHRVVCAADGAEGLAAARRLEPDLILLDLSLPVIDGWTVARTLAAEPWRARCRIVALTAHAMAGDRERALEAGCDGYLPKPLDEDALFAIVEELVAARERAS